MNPILRNILAAIAGWLGGSVINMGLVKIGHLLIPMAWIGGKIALNFSRNK